MLTVQPVRVSQQLPFRSLESSENYRYSKEQYESDKSALEEQLNDINSVIEDVNVPKPIKAFGKLVSVGIGAALGFVSMKYGAQGMATVMKKGAAHIKDIFQKPAMKSLGDNLGNTGKKIGGLFTELYNKIAISKQGQKIGELVTNLNEKIKGSKFVKKLNEFSNWIADSNIGKASKENLNKAKQVVKDTVAKITGEKVENGVVNLFAVSGGVSGGVAALQDATKD